MSWIPVILVAGGLFLGLSAVNWALFRLEENDGHRTGAVAFLAVGVVALGTALAIHWQPWLAFAPWLGAPEKADPLRAELANLEERLAKELDIMKLLSEGGGPTRLPEIQALRRSLLKTRVSLAEAADLKSPVRKLASHGDTLLGSAYYALGARWAAVKTPDQTNQDEAKRAARQVAAQLEEWDELRTCLLTPAQEGCQKAPGPGASSSTIQTFLVWFHPYAVELVRFEQHDPDLIDLSAPEHKRLQTLLNKARTELSKLEVDREARPLALAVDQLFSIAQQALSREQAGLAQGHWSAEIQRQTYIPVINAWAHIFNVVTCATGQEPANCGPS